MLPLSVQLQTRLPAKFVHEMGGPRLRLQAFVVVRDEDRRILCLKEKDVEGWMLPGELLAVNEAPDDAARRVVASWFKTPLEMWLSEVLSFPATGPEDDKWYLVFVYEADAPADLKFAEGTEEGKFFPPGPGPTFAMAHGDIWERLGA